MSGNTACSIGLLPFPTRPLGRPSCCQPVQPLVARTFVPTLDTMLGTARLLPAPEYEILPHLFCCWKGPSCHSPPMRRAAFPDPLGRHRACQRTGRLRKRAALAELVLARVCREACARVRYKALLRDLNIGVRATDGRGHHAQMCQKPKA